MAHRSNTKAMCLHNKTPNTTPQEQTKTHDTRVEGELINALTTETKHEA